MIKCTQSIIDKSKDIGIFGIKRLIGPLIDLMNNMEKVAIPYQSSFNLERLRKLRLSSYSDSMKFYNQDNFSTRRH